MTPTQETELFARLLGYFADRPKKTPTNWACDELNFDEPQNNGPFSLAGREYLREPIDSIADLQITDLVLVWGSQIGKTTLLMAIIAWTILNNPSRVMWVMPSRDLVQKFSVTRWIRMLLASPALAALIPTGRDRITQFKALEQQIGAAIIDFAWAGSATALSSTPCHMVVLDEVDKFQEETEKETNSVNLAEQRTKNAANPKRLKTSTPTILKGLIWQEMMKTDCRRRFLPCPGCGSFMVLAWSKTFTVFAPTGMESFIRWDKEAKRADGSWDLDRVERSARAECWKCGFHVQDRHKTLMDRNGQWRPTLTAGRGKKGWHLPSWYAPAVETNFGRLAVKFLEECKSLTGPRGFVNSEAAEPWVNQADVNTGIYEIIGPDAPALVEALPVLTVDCQMLAPFYWWVCRAWTREGDSRLLGYGSANSEDEIAAIQAKYAVPDYALGMDYKFSPQAVIQTVLNHGKTAPYGQGKLVWQGWKPMLGVPRNSIFKDSQNRATFVSMKTTLPHSKMRLYDLPLLHFNGPVCKDILDRLRKKKTRHKWELCPGVGDDYFKHLSAEYFAPDKINLKGGGWVHREHVPNHLWDCEVEQVAMALSLGRLKISADPKPVEQPEDKEMSHAE